MDLPQETITIDEHEVACQPQDNVVLAARRVGVEIPHYCWHEALSVVASCRMCLVEVGQRLADGSVSMSPKLQPACQIRPRAGMVVRTATEHVKSARAMVLEYLLLNHPLDCPTCDQAGECYLQDYSFKFGRAHSRLAEPKLQRPDKHHIGQQIVLFTDRCVMCTRCVRFTREISGTGELEVISRGAREEIDVFPGRPCDNKLAGNVVDLCPVGALCSKDFLYKKRVWWLRSQDSVCPLCSTGCSIKIDQSDNRIYRLRPRPNPLAQGHFMCDDGRFGFRYVASAERLTAPRLGGASDSSSAATTPAGPRGTGNGASSPHSALPPDLAIIDPWPAVMRAADQRIRAAVTRDAQAFVAVLSPFMTCEEAYLLASFLKGLDARVRLAMGTIPHVGTDDHYPKDAAGSPPLPAQIRFTIRAEKCPNRLGVAAVIEHFERRVTSIDDLVADESAGAAKVRAWYVVGGYPSEGSLAAIEPLVGEADLLIVQDMMDTPLSRRADIVLATSSFAERQGTFVNHAGLAQEIRPAIKPPGDARPDGRVLMELAGRRGLFHAEQIRREMAEAIPYFANFADGQFGAHGVRLTSAEAAESTATTARSPA
jgi:NADH-quinone oxidoreductase subunit G